MSPQANGDLVSLVQTQQSAVTGRVGAVRGGVVVGGGNALLILEKAYAHFNTAVAENVEVKGAVCDSNLIHLNGSSRPSTLRSEAFMHMPWLCKQTHTHSPGSVNWTQTQSWLCKQTHTHSAVNLYVLVSSDATIWMTYENVRYH